MDPRMKHIYAIRFDFPELRHAFNNAVAREDWNTADYINKIEVAALMFGRYNLAEQEDIEDARGLA